MNRPAFWFKTHADPAAAQLKASPSENERGCGLEQCCRGRAIRPRDDSPSDRRAYRCQRLTRAASRGMKARPPIAGIGIRALSDIERDRARGALNLIRETLVVRLDARDQGSKFLNQLDAQISDDE
jgi:hypothetical protein